MKARFFSAVLSALLLTAASVGVTASAEEIVVEVTEVTEETTAEILEENTDYTASADENDDAFDMMQFMEITENAVVTVDESSPDYYGDDYYDTNGNATLIQSESIIYNTEEMQFIAVTTKDGHVFYVLINYSAANGEDNVYFLNKVDDYDLYALLYAGSEDDADGSNITPEQAAQAAEEANGRVNSSADQDASDSANTSDEESSESDAEQTTSASMNTGNMYLVVGAIALIGVGAAGFFLMKKKKGGKSAVQTEAVDAEEEISEDEDYDFYDNEPEE